MNAEDRKIIAALLVGVSNDDTLSVCSAAHKLFKHHPKIIDEMSEKELAWWMPIIRPAFGDAAK